MPRLRIKLLGPPKIELDGAVLDLDHRKPVALLAYLAVTRQIHTRDALAALFWPEYGEARTYLRNNLWIIRKALGGWAESWLETELDLVGCKEGARLWLDVAEFQRLLAACRAHGHREAEVCAHCLAHLEQAVALYQVDFLAGFTLRDSPAFDQWQFFQSERLRQQLAGVLEKLVHYHTARGHFDQAILYAQRWLALDPLQEAVQRQLMQLYTWAGQPAAALRQYQACVRTLWEELHVQPDPETEALYKAIKTKQLLPLLAVVQQKDSSSPLPNTLVSTGLRPTSPPPLPAVDVQDRSPNNLLEQLTPLVGREKERTLLQSFLRRHTVRLVTLTGPGGVGKTRLALQVAADLLDDFRDGAYFVPLAPIHEAGLIPSALAQTLGIRELPGQPLLETLKNELHKRQMLLMLDNYEHLVTAAPMVTDLLSACPQLKILVTSREALHLRGEQEFTVPVLTTPVAQQATSLATLSQYEAVQLFIQRAQAVLPGFTVDNANAPAVAEICVRLDGLPLAIELAAARIKFFSPQVLLKKLRGPVGPTSLQLLQHGARDLPERHKTLRQTIAWSYELLIAEEQALFRKLCVFVGGFTIEAAASLGVADGMSAFDVLERIESLVNKSLVNRREQPDREPRFTLLETIREFGLELLQANNELVAAQRAHAEYYTAFTLALLVNTLGPRRAAIFDQLEEEHDNIRATLHWAMMVQAWPLAIRLVGPMRDLWYFRGHYREGQEWVERVLALAGEVKPSLELAEAIFCAGFLAHAHSDFRTARLRFAHCLQMSRQHGYLWSQSHAAALLANVAFEQGCYAEANSLLDEGLYAGEQLGTLLWHCGVMRANKANHALLLGHFAEAQLLCEQAFAIHRGIGEKWAIAQVYEFRSSLAYYQGDYRAASALRDQSERYNREVNDPRMVAKSFELHGLIAVEQGELDAAQHLLTEALKLQRKLGNRKDLALSLQNLAQVAATQGQPVRALQLAGAAAALRATISMVLPLMLRSRLDSTVRTAQQAVSPEAATAALSAGAAMTLDQAVAYALSETCQFEPEAALE